MPRKAKQRIWNLWSAERLTRWVSDRSRHDLSRFHHRRYMRRPLDSTRTPRQPGAESHHNHRVAGFQPPSFLRFRQGYRDRRAGRVAVAIKIDENAIARHADATNRGIDYPAVRLMRNEEIHIV